MRNTRTTDLGGGPSGGAFLYRLVPAVGPVRFSDSPSL